MVTVRTAKRRAKRKLADLIEKGEEMFGVKKSHRSARRAPSAKKASTRKPAARKPAARKPVARKAAKKKVVKAKKAVKRSAAAKRMRRRA